MLREKLEKAILELEELLREEKLHENRFQQYFEGNEVVFETLGYVNQYPKIQLKNDNNQKDPLYPDFILESQHSLFEVWDVKLPYENIIKETKNRNELYAKISTDYAGQLREYSDFFDDSSNRQLIFEEHKIRVQKKPKKFLIIGRDKNMDREKLHEILDSRSYDINILTYDDILKSVRIRLLSSSIPEQRLYGTSILTLVGIAKRSDEKERYIFDLAHEDRPERFSVFIDIENRINFNVVGADGRSHLLTHRIENIVEFKYFYFHFNIGCSKDFSSVEFYINGNRAGSLEVPQEISDRRGFDYEKRFLNCNVDKSNFGFISPELTKVYNCQLDLKTRIQEDDLFFERLRWLNQQPKAETVLLGEDCFIEFERNKLGQKSQLDRTLESLWDIHGFPFNGKPFRQIREEQGYRFSTLPPNTLELTELQRRGKISFKIGHPHEDWTYNQHVYDFGSFCAKGIYIRVNKSKDSILSAQFEGPLGINFLFNRSVKEIRNKVVQIDFHWNDDSTEFDIRGLEDEAIPVNANKSE